MELLEGERLRRRILEDYSRNPRGWGFTIAPSNFGFYNALVSGPEESWMVKIDSLFKPSPLMVGSPTDPNPPRTPESPFPFGYRRVSPEVMLGILGSEGDLPRKQRTASLLSVLRSETVVPMEGHSYAQGPFVFTTPDRIGLSEGQRTLDSRLTSEMKSLLRNRVPAYG